ncbi:hypothetical protein PHLGIDRAFT_283268 [Phlebiopsis gigantea 11061_1 CR5-6]|uniref:G-protein coupled receptors family 1 profile domain-containing protein n=1 Tax=Phlebiopsis gigantea (strain 11061_1 CR5-6) TaxID=745531 RepID=A0A0C3NDT4_PHLG1|nr:hypothetical protein PHLGIDRAFT_283268 [Phlebiopsis gigantea 11061_1 CR5-6]
MASNVTTPLNETGMRHMGLTLIYRIIPVLFSTVSYGIYIAILHTATRRLYHHGLKIVLNQITLVVMYLVFALNSAIWALEVAQLIALPRLFLNSPPSSDILTDFHRIIRHEARIIQVLFQCEMILADTCVIWRAATIWHDRRIVVLMPLCWWSLMIANMTVNASLCPSGASVNKLSQICYTTNILAPILSITTNISVTVLVLWKAWSLREIIEFVWRDGCISKLISLFVLFIESGTIYVLIMTTNLLITSLYGTGLPDSVAGMVDCISKYVTAQLVGIYPTLMLILIRKSLWNLSGEGSAAMSSCYGRCYKYEPSHNTESGVGVFTTIYADV